MNMEIVARIKPGVSVNDVARDVTQLRAQMEAALPRSQRDQQPYLPKSGGLLTAAAWVASS